MRSAQIQWRVIQWLAGVLIIFAMGKLLFELGRFASYLWHGAMESDVLLYFIRRCLILRLHYLL